MVSLPSGRHLGCTPGNCVAALRFHKKGAILIIHSSELIRPWRRVQTATLWG